jgi:hypothetical protein
MISAKTDNKTMILKIWKFFAEIGISSAASPSDKRRIGIVNHVILMCATFTLAFVPVMYFFGLTYYVPFQFTAGILCALGFLFSAKGKSDLAVLWLVLILGFNLFYCSVYFHDTNVPSFYFPLSIISFAIIKRNLLGYLATGFSVIGYALTIYCSNIIPVKGVIPEPALTMIGAAVIFTVFLASFVIIGTLKFANDRYEATIVGQKKLVEEQKKQVEEKQQEVLDSIYYARRIQRALITNEKYIERVLRKIKS